MERDAPPRCRNIEHRSDVLMIESYETLQSPVGHRPLDGPLLDAWFELNYRLQEEAGDIHVNRAFVERWIIRLWTIVSPRPQCFWLFLARINELALLCASRYVDCCEFAAADELLLAPSRIFLDPAGGRTVSQEKGGCAGRGRECIPTEMKSRPLVPCLYNLLKGSGYMTDGYLLSISKRTDKIAQVAGMLMGMGMHSTQDISMKLSCMDVAQRRDFRSRFCHFDQKIFNDIGRALHLFLRFGSVDDEYVGKYLRG